MSAGCYATPFPASDQAWLVTGTKIVVDDKHPRRNAGPGRAGVSVTGLEARRKPPLRWRPDSRTEYGSVHVANAASSRADVASMPFNVEFPP